MWCAICKANAHCHAVKSVKSHEATSSHKRESAAADAATRPAMESIAGRMLVSMNKALVDKLKIKFRTVHGFAKHARPYTDYVWQCSVDERKGLVIGTDYRSDKSASEFAHHIAEVSYLVFLAGLLSYFAYFHYFSLLSSLYIDSLHIISDDFSPDNT